MEIGLVERRLIKDLGPVVEIEEVWNVTVPGCPVLVLNLHEFKKDERARTVTIRTMMSKGDWNFANAYRDVEEHLAGND